MFLFSLCKILSGTHVARWVHCEGDLDPQRLSQTVVLDKEHVCCMERKGIHLSSSMKEFGILICTFFFSF
jgi:hypothetical protein